MKTILIMVFALTLVGLRSDTVTQDIKEAKIKIDLPNDEWFLAKKAEDNGLVVYMFKRNPIEDNEQREIIPNIAVIIEDIDKDQDVIKYSVIKRMEMPFEVDEAFIHESGKIQFVNAMGYRGHYSDKGLDHTIYIVHATNEGKGIQIICDVTTNIFGKVGPEFLLTLKSIRK